MNKVKHTSVPTKMNARYPIKYVPQKVAQNLHIRLLNLSKASAVVHCVEGNVKPYVAQYKLDFNTIYYMCIYIVLSLDFNTTLYKYMYKYIYI